MHIATPLPFKHPLCTIHNPLYLSKPLLNHLLHTLVRLLQIIRPYALVDLVLSQFLVVRAASVLNSNVGGLSRFLRSLKSSLPRLTSWWRDRDRNCERTIGRWLLGREAVWAGSDGGGYGFDVLVKPQVISTAVHGDSTSILEFGSSPPSRPQSRSKAVPLAQPAPGPSAAPFLSTLPSPAALSGSQPRPG